MSSDTPRTPAIIIACSRIEALMHGATHFRFTGKNATAVYSDGSQETAEISPEMASEVESYYNYKERGGPPCDCPSTFSILAAIQSARAKGKP